MNRRKIRYIYEVIFGICAMISCTVLSILVRDITMASFVLTIIVTCLVSVVKITIGEDSGEEIKVIFNGICLCQYYTNISCFFILCVKILNKVENVAFNSVWLYGDILDLAILIVVIWVIKKKKTLSTLINVVFVVAISIIFLCAKLLPKDISPRTIEYMSYIIAAGANIIYIYLGKKYIYNSRYEGKRYYNIFLVCRILEYICICILYRNANIPIICLNIEIIQMYVILKSALVNCIDEPRKMTFTALEAVEVKIDSHNAANKIIVNLSHELKTPINIIRSAVDLLLLDCTQGKLYKKIIKLKEECIDIMNVIQLMIDIQKLKSGTCIIRNKVYNIVTIVDNVIEAISEEYVNINILFNPAEEEIFTNIDIHLFQQGLVGLFTILIGDKSKKSIYVEMKRIRNDRVYISIFSDSSNKIGELIREVKEFKYQKNIVGLLEIQYLQEILHMHKGKIKYIDDYRKNFIEISFPCSQYSQIAETPIDENNVYELREKIRYSYLVGTEVKQ